MQDIHLFQLFKCNNVMFLFTESIYTDKYIKKTQLKEII